MAQTYAYIKRRAGHTEMNTVCTAETLEELLNAIAIRETQGDADSKGMHYYSVVRISNNPTLEYLTGCRLHESDKDLRAREALALSITGGAH